MAPKSSLASFAIPRAAIDALLHAKADAVTIGAYLTLACHTDDSGQFSTAGLKAVREHIGVNRGRAEKAVRTLATIKPTPKEQTKPKKQTRGKPQDYPKGISESPSVLSPRDTQGREMVGELPDGPTERSRVRYLLPTFKEPLEKRVWIPSSLVHGNDVIDKPLRALKDCGDVAARMLLALYAGQDLDRWYGIAPHEFLWAYYRLDEIGDGPLRILLAFRKTRVLPIALQNRVSDSPTNTPCFTALTALEHAGLLYESVVLLNRDPVPSKFSNGEAYGEIPDDAEILCDLGSSNPFGPVLEMERGLGTLYKEMLDQIAKQRGHADAHVFLNAREVKATPDYLALIATGHPAMIAGLYRLRFRVTNPKNAFIEEATRRHLDANAAALKRLNYLRKMHKLEPLTSTLQSSSIPLQSLSISSMLLNPERYGEGSFQEGKLIGN